MVRPLTGIILWRKIITCSMLLIAQPSMAWDITPSVRITQTWGRETSQTDATPVYAYRTNLQPAILVTHAPKNLRVVLDYRFLLSEQREAQQSKREHYNYLFSQTEFQRGNFNLRADAYANTVVSSLLNLPNASDIFEPTQVTRTNQFTLNPSYQGNLGLKTRYAVGYTLTQLNSNITNHLNTQKANLTLEHTVQDQLRVSYQQRHTLRRYDDTPSSNQMEGFLRAEYVPSAFWSTFVEWGRERFDTGRQTVNATLSNYGFKVRPFRRLSADISFGSGALSDSSKAQLHYTGRYFFSQFLYQERLSDSSLEFLKANNADLYQALDQYLANSINDAKIRADTVDALLTNQAFLNILLTPQLFQEKRAQLYMSWQRKRHTFAALLSQVKRSPVELDSTITPSVSDAWLLLWSQKLSKKTQIRATWGRQKNVDTLQAQEAWIRNYTLSASRSLTRSTNLGFELRQEVNFSTLSNQRNTENLAYLSISHSF